MESSVLSDFEGQVVEAVRECPDEVSLATVWRLLAIIDRLVSRVEAAEAVQTCEWREDTDGIWISACGSDFEFTEGSPEENNVRYCHRCGKATVFVHYQEETDDDE